MFNSKVHPRPEVFHSYLVQETSLAQASARPGPGQCRKAKLGRPGAAGDLPSRPGAEPSPGLADFVADFSADFISDFISDCISDFNSDYISDVISDFIYDCIYDFISDL